MYGLFPLTIDDFLQFSFDSDTLLPGGGAGDQGDFGSVRSVIENMYISFISESTGYSRSVGGVGNSGMKRRFVFVNCVQSRWMIGRVLKETVFPLSKVLSICSPFPSDR